MMKVSVIMATCNGEAYLEQQLDSIIKQLDSNSEIIISDDCSTDKTKNIIDQFNDSRILLLQNKTSLGIIKNFEHALAHATGDIIFLSDQDDIWLPGKIEVCTKWFSKYDLVITDCKVVNENLEILQESYFTKHRSGKGIIKNLAKNTYLGCCIAFKKELLKLILPFPEKIPMHDIWIGFVSEIFFKTNFINDKMVLYRRHGNNASTSSEKSKYNLLKKISFRLNTLRYLPLLLKRRFQNKPSEKNSL